MFLILSSSDDFESKFNFHPFEDLPPPEEYRHVNKVYPSKTSKGTSTRGTEGVHGEYTGSTREYTESTRRVHGEYTGSTRGEHGVHGEYTGSTRGVHWVWSTRGVHWVHCVCVLKWLYIWPLVTSPPPFLSLSFSNDERSSSGAAGGKVNGPQLRTLTLGSVREGEREGGRRVRERKRGRGEDSL